MTTIQYGSNVTLQQWRI